MGAPHLSVFGSKDNAREGLQARNQATPFRSGWRHVVRTLPRGSPRSSAYRLEKPSSGPSGPASSNIEAAGIARVESTPLSSRWPVAGHGAARRMAMLEERRPLAQDLPPEISRVLDDFLARAREALGADLESVVLYGSAAEGALRPTSDVNVLLVLTAFDRAK